MNHVVMQAFCNLVCFYSFFTFQASCIQQNFQDNLSNWAVRTSLEPVSKEIFLKTYLSGILFFNILLFVFVLYVCVQFKVWI